MKKKTLICMLIISLVASVGLWNLAYADDLDDQMEQVEQEKEEASAEMSKLTKKVESAKEEVDKIQAKVDAKQKEINQAEKDIEKTKERIKKRQEGLNSRLRTMYKNGSVGYLDVLLGSNSISEFLNNMEMIQRIYRNDQDTLVELEEQHTELEQKQSDLEKEKAALDADLEEQKEKEEKLKTSQTELQEKIDALNAEADSISAEIAARQEALKAEQEKNNSNTSNDNDNDSYDGGQFLWPCDSRYITSEYGYRIHPLTGIWTGHTGIDIGCSMYAPIYAAESGTVILSQWYGGYGYAVVIDHGGGISTLYGHNEELYVSVGQKVKRGDVIAGAGSTGWSTGPHLHFEVRVNGDYVDPMGYL
ncbi:MAG: peptidoglycan DD-metalloendopeptidase family protein [Firmicutes bacterium]|nr:peptidoglycan DD-metalloendopeptidase family protein [Bacillota bacterium]